MKTRTAAAKKTSATKAPALAKQVLGTRVKITLDDTPGKESITLETPRGQKIILSDVRGGVEISDGNGSVIKLEPTGVSVLAAGRITVKANEVKISAATVVVDAGTSKFNGLVQCDTLVANSVVSASYTPGAGNIL